ncbi:STAS domain-containing protein [Mycobacterium avium]|nr:STAS domain-containing protein [Mycobacterium avium]
MPSNTSVVHVDGPLLADTTAPMRRTVSDELLRTPELLALNLTGVTTIDTAGIDALTSAAMQAGESDIGFCLLGAQHGPVGAALSQANLTELFEMFNSLDDVGIPLAPPHPGRRNFLGRPTTGP